MIRNAHRTRIHNNTGVKTANVHDQYCSEMLDLELQRWGITSHPRAARLELLEGRLRCKLGLLRPLVGGLHLRLHVAPQLRRRLGVGERLLLGLLEHLEQRLGSEGW